MAELHITLCFSARAGLVHEQALHLLEGTTVQQAFEAASRLGLPDFPSDKQALEMIGIWGKLSKPEQVLRDGDRLECYRPLTVDPKVARRERFARQGAKSAGLFSRSRPGAKAGY